MMLITIDPNPPANPGMDFGFLKAEGTELVQRLAGKIWTDYNESDPGVTILEQLCYALTELSYRAEFPVQDFLIDPLDGRIHPRRQALYPAKRIFPCNPVTVKDYRKLLLDRIPELGNAWLTPHRPEKQTSRSVDGLYDIALYVPGLEPPPCGPVEEDRVRGEARRVYCRHRNLCEDVRSIYVLRPVRTVVHAEVSVTDVRTPEAILAGILFNVGNLIAPEPRRRTLKSLVEAGVPPSEIFEGPLLLNGFIDSAQLQPKAECVPVPEVVRAIARSEGVQGVRNVKVRARGKEYSGNEHVKVRRTQILQLDTAPDKRGFSIRMTRNGIEVQPNPAKVRRELEKLWAEQRRTYRLAAQYDEYFAFPEGQRRNFEQYFSIQDQFPNVYGISSYGLPSSSPPPREAQAKQLKGYLLVFDQLLADFFAQLAHVRDLYSTEKGPRQTYFWQSLERSVPNLPPLLKGGEECYRQGLAAIARDQDSYVERRNRFLDFLLALYAERLDVSSIWDLTPGDQEDEETGRQLIHAKRELLRHLPVSTHNRGRGFDYLERPSPGNIAGMLIKSRIQLGLPVFGQRPLEDVLEEFGVELAESDVEASVGRALHRHAEHIQEQLAPVAAEEGEGTAALPRGLKIPEELALGAAEVEELRMGSLPGESAVSLVWKSRSKGDWRLLGKYPDRGCAQAAGRAFLELLRSLSRHGRQLYVVEHSLLRFGRFREPDEGFVYDFTLTAVTSDGDEDYRRFVRQVIRQNTPSHIAARYLFLSPARMRRFENMSSAWQAALRRRNRREINAASAALRRFLVKHQEA